jgi:DNA-binding transcriptional ArsR family regulator
VTWKLKTDQRMRCICEEGKQQLPAVNDKGVLLDLAEMFKALGDPTRLEILSLLLIEDLCMCEIVTALSLPNSTVSHHLKIMEKGGVIKGRREGKYTIYRLCEERVESIITFLRKQ